MSQRESGLHNMMDDRDLEKEKGDHVTHTIDHCSVHGYKCEASLVWSIAVVTFLLFTPDSVVQSLLSAFIPRKKLLPGAS